jgi:hypothetical protein
MPLVASRLLLQLGGSVGNCGIRSLRSISPRLDLYTAVFAVGVMTIAAPLPVLGSLHQLARHWVAMDVLQFLDELFVVPFVPVVVTFCQNGSSK